MKFTRYVLLVASLAILSVMLLPTILLAFQPDTSGIAPPPVPVDLYNTLGYILFVLSEILAWVPAIKSNSIVQFVFNILVSIYKKLIPKTP